MRDIIKKPCLLGVVLLRRRELELGRGRLLLERERLEHQLASAAQIADEICGRTLNAVF